MMTEEAAIEPEAVEPALAIEPEATEAVSQPEPEPQPQPQPEPKAAEPEPKGKPADVPPWVWERIGEETRAKQAAEQRASQQERRAAEYEQILQRLQAGDKAAPAAPKAPAASAADQSQLEQEAARIVFQRDLQKISETGLSTYGAGWEQAIHALNACGVNSTEFVASVMEIEPGKTHDIMFRIAQNPEQAVALAKMSPARRIAEITRTLMAETKAKDEPKIEKTEKTEPAISKAPAPKPAITPRAAAPEIDPTTPEGDAKMTDDKAWEAWYKNKYMKRSA